MRREDASGMGNPESGLHPSLLTVARPDYAINRQRCRLGICLWSCCGEMQFLQRQTLESEGSVVHNAPPTGAG
jgi:hypothetical protein